MRLRGKTVFISGAAAPMGLAIAQCFAKEGANLALADISGRRLAEVESSLPSHAEVFSAKTNVLDDGQVRDVVAKAVSRFGGIDVVVNIVGGIVGQSIATPMLEMSEEQFDGTLQLNLKSIFLTTRHIVPLMQARKSGRIVNIGSCSMAGERGQADYSAAKAGVAGITRTMAIEFASDITVNCIAPSLIRTRVLDRLDDSMIEEFRDRTLLKRLGEPEDIAGAALFLVSDESAFVTGQIMSVSGGIWPAL
jgi:3-oxoacyl-[acyl-carrier protein] reductase